MTRLLTPGVIPQDAYPPPRQILLTGVPVFLGRAAAGPRTPQQVRLWPQFASLYGESGPLADAVRGFFANDGLVCRVVRLDETLPLPDRLRAGLAAFDASDGADEADLVCAPDLADAGPEVMLAAQRLLVGACRARGDRVALLDAVPAPGDVAAQAAALTGPDGGFGALYHPWPMVATPGGPPRRVPPCGHVAGLVARGDRRVGTHKAPANEELADVLDLAVGLTAQQVGELYAAGVNCVRALPGRGIRVWGARTLSGDPGTRDLSARRVLVTITRWLGQFMPTTLYEPHDLRLRVRMVREVTAYLDGLHQRGALRGQTAADAFWVKCDDETNPPAVADQGLLVTQIGVAPSVAAEFVVVRVIHGTSGVRIDAA